MSVVFTDITNKTIKERFRWTADRRKEYTVTRTYRRAALCKRTTEELIQV
jgi:hypothetical protein